MKCKAPTKSGHPCRNEALPDSNYCRVPSHQLLAVGDAAKAAVPVILVPPKPEPVEADNVCGHVNVHAQPHHLTCDLEAGHEGDHSSLYQAIDYKMGGVTRDEQSRTYWKDMAGTPVEEIEPDLYTLPKTHPLHPHYEEHRKAYAQ